MTVEPFTTYRDAVHQFLDWENVELRLKQFPAIGRAFDLEVMRRRSQQGPYYCHYMAWRLSRWPDESLISRLDQLLSIAEELPGWRFERPLLESAEYAEYWSLVWQLQMAEYLVSIGESVEWSDSGPDLSVEMLGERWFVECYCFRKSFGLLNYIEDILFAIEPSVRVAYDKCMQFSLPSNSERESFLSDVSKPFLNASLVEDAKREALVEYPVVLFDHQDSSLVIYIEGEGDYMPGRIPNRTGSPSGYLKVALEEAASAKEGRNQLSMHRPNLVAVNFLLSTDFQLARSSAWQRDGYPLPRLPDDIDGLAVGTVGIDELVKSDSLSIIRGTHPTLACFGATPNAA